MKGVSECKFSERKVRRIQVKDIIKEVEDHLKTYSSARMDISCFKTTRDTIMSGTLLPIPPPLGTSTISPSSPNANRVDTMLNADSTNTTTTNVARNVVEENNDNLPQLLDSRGGSHVTNFLAYDKDDFTSCNIRFLVFLDGLEPYLIATLKDGPFVPMSNLSTPTNLLPKRPSDIRDTKIVVLRIKVNAFKALKGEKVNGTYTRLKCLLNDLENNEVIISQSKVNATFVNSLPRKWLSMNQTQRANNSIKNDSLAALCGKYYYEEGKGDKGKSDKGLIANLFEWDDESMSLEDEGTTKFKAFMAIAEDEPSIGKALGGKGRRKERNLKVLFTKNDVSLSEPTPMITSNSEDDNDNQVLLPPLPKLSGAEPSGASKSLISLSDLTTNMANLTLNTTKRFKNSSDKVSQTYVITEKTKPKPPSVQLTCPDKNAPPSTKQLLLTLMEEVKGYEICRSIPHEIADCPKNLRNNRKPRVDINQSEPTKKWYMYRYSKESGLKVVFGDNSSGDKEGYGSINCNGITFTKVKASG
nr:retrovirus-related Pol polyprotein from transposon TNT 1-94 [Tanacetum cinerariifolium]